MAYKQIPWDLQTKWQNRQNDHGNGSYDGCHQSASGKAYHLNQQALRARKRAMKRLGSKALRQVGRDSLREQAAEDTD